MNKLSILKKAVWTEPSLNDEAAFAELKSEFPGRSARRMTRLGMQMSHVLRAMPITEASSLVYATSYSETCTIEKFLDSFPYPSPQAFQTSIHPGGVEQYLIQNKQAVREFLPLAGKSDLLFRALSTSLLCQSETVILCGGEERGTWLSDTGVSSEANYAWALELQAETQSGAIGEIRWQGLAEDAGDVTIMPRFLDALSNERSFRYEGGSGAEMELSWRV